MADDKSKNRLVLTLNVEYSLNGEQVGDLKSRLMRMIERAVDEGLLTGEGPAEVEEYSYRVEVLGDQPSQEEIQEYFQNRIDSGNFDPEDTAKLMVRYGAMIPEFFFAEMAERMEMEESDAADDQN